MTMTLGTMIQVVENGRQNTDDDCTIHYVNPEDGKYQGIGELHSWRGRYQDLCLSAANTDNWLSMQTFFCMLRGALGLEFTGYKGGEYEMTEDTFIWRESYGNSERMTHGITHITFDCSIALIHTKLMDTFRFTSDVNYISKTEE